MTAVGKILVVLHLVLSVMFMAFAGAIFTAQNNWRAKEKATAALLAAEKKKSGDMQTEFDRQMADSKAKMDLLESDAVRLKGANTALDIEVKTLTADNKQLRKEVDQQRDQATLTTAEASERKKESDLQREKNNTLYDSREELAQKLYETEEKRFATEVQLQQTTEKFEQLFANYRTVIQFLASKNMTTDPKEMIATTTPPPPVEGRVLHVLKPDRGSRRELLQISIGRDSGLEIGHRLTVYRGGKYLGTIRLTRVESDTAVGYVEPRPAPNAHFEIDDEVTTRF